MTRVATVLLVVCLGLFVGCKSKSNAINQSPQFLANDSIQADKEPEPDPEFEDYYEEDHLRYDNYIYEDSIRTVLLHQKNWPLSMPILRLKDEDSFLELNFDDLHPTFRNLSYTFIHCNANWEPSNVNFNQAINGLPEDDIRQFSYSRNTLQRYVHYELTFPNQNMEFLISGNYIIKVYETDYPERLILTWRFMVAEDQVHVEPNIHRGSRVQDRNRGQEFDFVIRGKNNYQLINPYTDLHVAILQNQRWDNAKTDLKPTFANNNELIYDYAEENVFLGGNEFRFFDVKNLQFRTETVERLIFTPPANHAYLVEDQKRAFKVYLERPDINGQRLISMGRNSFDPRVDGDYVHIHFKLNYPQVLTNGDLYIFGALTNWTYDPKAKMVYNYRTQKYEGELYVKQGYYNYQYVFVGDGAAAADATMIEGTHFQTENQYHMFVYHRTPGLFYDRLLSASSIDYPPNR